MPKKIKIIVIIIGILMLVFSNMSRAERNFIVPEELATSAYRGINTGSGVGGSWELKLREALKDHLGLGSTVTASPEHTVIPR